MYTKTLTSSMTGNQKPPAGYTSLHTVIKIF